MWFSRAKAALAANGGNREGHHYVAAIDIGDDLGHDSADVLTELGVNVTQSDTAVTVGWTADRGTVLTGVDASRLTSAKPGPGVTVTRSATTTTFRFRADGADGKDDPPGHVLPRFLMHVNVMEVDGARLRFGPSAAAIKSVAGGLERVDRRQPHGVGSGRLSRRPARGRDT